MVKKMKSPLEGLDPQQLQAGLRESAQQIWMAGLGAFAKAQSGGNKVFEALMKDGGSLQSRTRKAARDQVDDMAAKASGTWDKLEQVFEKRVAQTLHTLGVPTHEDIETLSRRVAELSALVEALQKGGPAEGKPTAKQGAAKQATAQKPVTRKVTAKKVAVQQPAAKKSAARRKAEA